MALRRARSVVAVLATGWALVLAPLPAQAARGEYVALGDSYSSGVGTRSYLRDGTTCQRSTDAYPALVAAGRGLALTFRACSGATTADVADLQLDALSSATTHVTVTVGGNDASFTDVLTDCAKPAWMSSCTAAVDRAQHLISTRLPSRLSALYAAIRDRAPRARVVVVGYPRVFDGEDCNSATWFSPTEMSRLNATADLLNARTETAARAAGLLFVDPTRRFLGHAVCGTTEWVNGLSRPTSDSYHANRAGHSAGFVPLVASSLTGTSLAVTTATRRAAAATGAGLAQQQRSYADQDRGIEPEQFVLPDLTTAQARAAAVRAGVRLDDRASIDAVDRRHDAAQASADR